MSAAIPIRAPGRPRDPRRDEAILDAAIELVSEVGYERVTIDAIAARAGVGRPTVYRRWPGGKADVVLAALQQRRCALMPELEDTGSLRGDLVALVQRLIEHFAARADFSIGMLVQLRESAEFARLFREHMLPARGEWLMAPVKRAIARGELPAEPPVSPLFMNIAPALVFGRAQLQMDPLDDAFVAELVDRILLPILRGTDGP